MGKLHEQVIVGGRVETVPGIALVGKAVEHRIQKRKPLINQGNQFCREGLIVRRGCGETHFFFLALPVPGSIEPEAFPWLASSWLSIGEPSPPALRARREFVSCRKGGQSAASEYSRHAEPDISFPRLEARGWQECAAIFSAKN